MATLNELSELLAERTGRQLDIPYREELKVMINYWRTRLLVDSLNSRPDDRKFFMQWIEMPVEVVNLSDFAGFPDHEVLRTKCKIPKPIRANSKMYDFVGKLDRISTIPIQEPYEVAAMIHSEFNSKQLRGTLINGYIYIFGTLLLPGISVALIPESIEAYNACCVDCGSPTCVDDNAPYPISGDIEQRIIQAILATELKTIIPPQTPEIENVG